MRIDRSNLFGYVMVFLIGIGAGMGGLALSNRAQPAPIRIEPPPPTTTPAPTATPQPIEVFVNGAVAEPDLYVLPPRSRVVDAIEAAGGFAEGAQRAVVNLAQPLADGAQVYVPSVMETAVPPPEVVTEPIAPAGSANSAAAGAPGELIDINRAAQAELETLPGIGPSTAESIVRYREENGRFTSLESIMEVPGIGPAKLEQIREFVTVGQ